MVFKRALKALVDSMWTSSIIYILYFPELGGYKTSSFICLISFTLVLEAPSISITSRLVPAAISLQEEHTPQGLTVGPFWQLRDFARIRAELVFPHPLGPEKR